MFVIHEQRERCCVLIMSLQQMQDFAILCSPNYGPNESPVIVIPALAFAKAEA
jgi:hypothetical protein